MVYFNPRFFGTSLVSFTDKNLMLDVKYSSISLLGDLKIQLLYLPLMSRNE